MRFGNTPSAKYVVFMPIDAPDGYKTKIWSVLTRDGGLFIGEIRWYSRWRQYAFMPDYKTVYEKQCLRDIALFCETETAKHKGRKVK